MNCKLFWSVALAILGFIVIETVFADTYPVVVEAEATAVLSAEREGVLSELNVAEGGSVQKGGLIAVVYHKDLEFRKEQGVAKKEYFAVKVENLTKLNEKGLVTDEELARAKMEQHINTMDIAMIDAEIARSTILAPFSGIVTARRVNPHEWVRPGQPVIELYSPNDLRITGDIPAKIASGLKKGRSYTLTFQDLQKDIKANLDVIIPQINVKSNTIKVVWNVPKSGYKAGLLPGMKGFIDFGSE